MLSLEKMELFDVELPTTNPTTNLGMSAFSGLGGYMTLGLGAKERKPASVGLERDEALVPKESKAPSNTVFHFCFIWYQDTSIIIGADGKLSRSSSINWPAPPEENSLYFSQTISNTELILI